MLCKLPRLLSKSVLFCVSFKYDFGTSELRFADPIAQAYQALAIRLPVSYLQALTRYPGCSGTGVYTCNCDHNISHATTSALRSLSLELHETTPSCFEPCAVLLQKVCRDPHRNRSIADKA